MQKWNIPFEFFVPTKMHKHEWFKMICKGHTACIAQLNAAKIKIADTLPLLSLCRRSRHCPEGSQAGHCSRLRQHTSRISHQTSRPKGPSMACCLFYKSI